MVAVIRPPTSVFSHTFACWLMSRQRPSSMRERGCPLFGAMCVVGCSLCPAHPAQGGGRWRCRVGSADCRAADVTSPCVFRCRILLILFIIIRCLLRLLRRLRIWRVSFAACAAHRRPPHARNVPSERQIRRHPGRWRHFECVRSSFVYHIMLPSPPCVFLITTRLPLISCR